MVWMCHCVKASSDRTMLSSVICFGRVGNTRCPNGAGLTSRRIFQLAMAYDALRLRNIIQLIGILSALPKLLRRRQKPSHCDTVFQVAMMVFAALQVHQTHSALVIPNQSGCDDPATFNFVVGAEKRLDHDLQLTLAYRHAVAQGRFGEKLNHSLSLHRV